MSKGKGKYYTARRSARIQIALTDAQIDRIRAAAFADDVSVSEFCRRAIDADLNSPANVRRRAARMQGE